MSSGFAYIKPASGELGTFTKAQLDTAVTDGNVVYVGDALNGTLGATTPASVAATTGAFSDQLSLSHAPAVSESVIVLTGSVLTGGTGTTNFPAILCQPTGATAATAWSTGGTWFGVNAASGFAGRFLDFRVNGAAGVFSVNSAGWLNMSGVFASSRTSISGTAAVSYTGSVFTGGTGTTNLPHILAEPSGTTAATTWSTSGTFVGINAASGYAGNFIDLRLNGGASLFAIASTGAITGLSITESANAATGTGGLVRATSPTLVTPALGTPSSGVVTNLTGTASININGTVGATTPASVAATTVTATSISLSGADASANLIATSASGGITISRAGAPGMWLFPGDGRYVMVSTGYTGWTSGSTPTSGQDSRISRSSAGVLQIGTTANNALGSLLLTNLTASGTLSFTTVGNSITYKSGTGQRAGNATLVSGTVTVTNTSITANSVIILTRKTAGGTIGDLTYTLSAGASFTINSANILDTSVVSYLIQEVV
jgi:hypothetical protein